jgi:KDO2-lipid IV(A) lauroyltransferase
MVSTSVRIDEKEGSQANAASARHSSRVPPLLLLVRVIARLPFSIRSVVGWMVGYIIGLLPLRERRFTLLQLKVFMPEVAASRIAPRVFANAGRTLLESLSLKPVITRHSRHIQCEAWPTVDQWIASERPIIALTAHTGNWDLLAAYVIARGVPLTTIGREARSPSAQLVLRSIREGYGIETIWRSDRSGLKRLIQCLKERRVVAALIDQDTRVDSISVPFFGTPAKTPVSLISLGMKANARFVTAFLFRTGWLRYTIFVEEIPALHTEQEILAEYNLRLERLIRQYPEQWVWFHKRWRSRPDGVTLSSREYQTLLTQRLQQQTTVL